MSHCGLLQRKAEQQPGGREAPSRKWKDLYVVLSGQLLSFYASRKDFDNMKPNNPPLSLAGARCEPATNYHKKANAFRVKPADGSCFLFAAKDSMQSLEWQRKISYYANVDPSHQLDEYPAHQTTQQPTPQQPQQTTQLSPPQQQQQQTSPLIVERESSPMPGRSKIPAASPTKFEASQAQPVAEPAPTELSPSPQPPEQTSPATVVQKQKQPSPVTVVQQQQEKQPSPPGPKSPSPAFYEPMETSLGREATPSPQQRMPSPQPEPEPEQPPVTINRPSFSFALPPNLPPPTPQTSKEPTPSNDERGVDVYA